MSNIVCHWGGPTEWTLGRLRGQHTGASAREDCLVVGCRRVCLVRLVGLVDRRQLAPFSQVRFVEYRFEGENRAGVRLSPLLFCSSLCSCSLLAMFLTSKPEALWMEAQWSRLFVCWSRNSRRLAASAPTSCPGCAETGARARAATRMETLGCIFVLRFSKDRAHERMMRQELEGDQNHISPFQAATAPA